MHSAVTRRALCWLIFLALILSRAARCDEPPAIAARAAVLIDGASGRVLFADNADKRYPMASTTKIMTCLLALENCAMDESVTAGALAASTPGTSIYLRQGETLLMRDMLLGLMLRSGNDAAVAVAEHISGSVAGFADLMNERAASLNADAYFVNPHGLDEKGHEASALGMARIAREALKNDAFRALVSTQKAIIPWPGNPYDRALTNKNRLLREFEGATGVKTGFTDGAGRCLVFSAHRDGMELIGVVLGCGTWFDSAEALLSWGFASFQPVVLARRGETLARAVVSRGVVYDVPLAAAEDVVVALRPDEDVALVVSAPETLSAPVHSGDTVGDVAAQVAGRVVFSCPLVCARDVDRASFASALRRVAALWSAQR